ncbi:unnamed protein product [Rotaria sp. Silwood1]|nr:unnamed protein product [Rotaria sp. Silwood1]
MLPYTSQSLMNNNSTTNIMTEVIITVSPSSTNISNITTKFPTKPNIARSSLITIISTPSEIARNITKITSVTISTFYISTTRF